MPSLPLCQFLRARMAKYSLLFGIDQRYGFTSDPMKRATLQAIICDHIGPADRDLKHVESLLEDSLWTFRRLPAPLRRWAWTSRGLISVETMSEMVGLPESEIFRDVEEPSCENSMLADFVICFVGWARCRPPHPCLGKAHPTPHIGLSRPRRAPIS